MIFRIQRGRAGYLAYIANRILMRRREPVRCLPRRGCEVHIGSFHENRNVFGVEIVSVRTAVPAPQMIVVNLSWWKSFCRPARVPENLAVDSAVFGFDFGRSQIPRKLRPGTPEQSARSTISCGANC